MKINIESSPPEIWIRIRFHNRSGSPSLAKGLAYGTHCLVSKGTFKRLSAEFRSPKYYLNKYYPGTQSPQYKSSQAKNSV